MTDEYNKAFGDHVNNVPRQADEPFLYRTIRDRLESEQNPRKAQEHEQKKKNEGAAGLFLVAAGALVWLVSSVWAWLSDNIKSVAAFQPAVELHPWVVIYYKLMGLILLGPLMVVYEETRSLLRWAAWFPWPGLAEPFAVVVSLLIAAAVLGALIYGLIKWKWFRWLLPLVIFGPIVVALGLRFLARM